MISLDTYSSMIPFKSLICHLMWS